MKQTKNYYSLSRPQIAALVQTNIKTILDVGCGQGAFLQLIKQRTGAETWGIELVPEVAEKAKINVDKIIIGKVENLLFSLPDAYFECITFNDVLEHLLEPAEVLELIKSKLSENGVIIASIPNVRYFYNLYDLIFRKDWEYKDAGILD
jgi:2-polyprenyl-3-methyl-5-hydroxy-6-metoxy-1,4-benzoquinol methylase